jgi:hypothetical protein
VDEAGRGVAHAAAAGALAAALQQRAVARRRALLAEAAGYIWTCRRQWCRRRRRGTGGGARARVPARGRRRRRPPGGTRSLRCPGRWPPRPVPSCSVRRRGGGAWCPTRRKSHVVRPVTKKWLRPPTAFHSGRGTSKVCQLQRQRVPRGHVVAPEVPRHVDARVERHVDGEREERVVGEALVPPHPVVENDVQRVDVGVVPARLLDRAADELRAEAAVRRVPAHVRPRGQRAAAPDHVRVEPQGQLLHVDVPPVAQVVLDIHVMPTIRKLTQQPEMEW